MGEELKSLDLFILHALNSLCGMNWFLDHAVGLFQFNNLVKIGPFLAIFWVIWFNFENQDQNRQKLILLLFAVFIASIANRVLSEIMPFRARPIFVPEIGIRPSLLEYPISARLENFSSFPSDHAALLFGMTAAFWFVSRPIGILMSVWATCVLISRVYFGAHFPSDILVGAMIGIGAAVIANRNSYLRSLAALVIAAERRASPYFYAALFFATFEIGTLFVDARQLANGAFKILHRIVYLHVSS
jgi:membrane-associated phospholipid phosphatase